MRDPLLSVQDFSVVYDVDPPVEAVSNVSLVLQRGEILGLAGESGCGKTTLAYGIQRLLRAPAVITGGSVVFHDASGDDIDINTLDNEAMRRFRWDKISMVFQGAMNALNPVVQVGAQLEDVFEVHRPGMTARQRRHEARELLEIVKVGGQRMRSYPHELSGGMRQRVMIAMALALRPQLMVMDEPTTALDVLVQREILRQISQLRHEFGFSVIFITHDLPCCWRSATGSPSCAKAGSSNSTLRNGSGPGRSTTTRRRCCHRFHASPAREGWSCDEHAQVQPRHQDLQRPRRGPAPRPGRRQLHAEFRADHRVGRPVGKRQVDDREDPHPARTGHLG
ncbi:ABC transporter ATP-binding protein [Tessaracoccus coleopterorum]|nr:ABC transporter ATP-binding protein [Tessaracoccus coleopterorum]